MGEASSRSDRWRRTLAAGFVASVLVHAGVLAFLGLGGVFLPEAEDDRLARAGEADRRWERRAIRVVDARVRRPVAPDAAPASPSRAEASTPAASAGGAAGPARAKKLVEIRQRTAGSVVARRAVTRMASIETGRTAERVRSRRERAQPASVRPASDREARTVFRPANEAARRAAREGGAPDFGDGTLVVDGSGRPSDWGRDGRRGGGREGVYFGGGSCSGGAGTIDRAIPDGLLVGG